MFSWSKYFGYVIPFEEPDYEQSTADSRYLKLAYLE